jgi:hypothetical protein
MKHARVLLAGLLLAAAGCVTVQKVKPAEFIPAHSPPVVWVTTNDNSYTPVARPEIVGDTLKGMWVGMSEPVAISLDEIRTVQAKMPSPKRTALLVTVLGLATGGVIYTMVTAGTTGPQGCNVQVIKGTPTDYCCDNIPAGDKTTIC